MATNTINDLYLKYTNKVGRALENDRYFQYLYEMVQAGENVLQQNNQVLHKVVDERWLTMIEESLDAINKVIDNPRRFVTTTEEVVPVALAKKITADSVRHLSMNTQFIASNEEGNIQPTKVLNVSTEESYNLYENRFVYHLIQRLVTFIDKRTDVIFWATGDETQNVLNFQSKVDDAYEEIEYKIEMKVKNRQSFAENDADNMSVFMRIDRVRRMVMALKHSSFCDLMAGCPKVRSPIQRTNLIMKDPNYRTCYKLWQFLESYDDVGYTIEVQNTALQFDEEYLIQMYTNLITNYTVFKSLLEADDRNPKNLLATKRKVIKPKFIKKIKEEIVDDYNIEDVEIRQVIIEEVTQAQLDAEAKLAEETEARKKAEEALEDMDSQMVSLQQQVSNLMMRNQEAEIRAEEERQAKENALAELETAKEQVQAAEAETKTARDETRIAQEDARKAREEAKTVEEEAADRIEKIREEADIQIARIKKQADDNMEDLQHRTDEEMKVLEQQCAKEVDSLRQQNAEELEKLRQQNAERIENLQNQAAKEKEDLQRKNSEEIENLKIQSAEEIENLKSRTAEEIENLKKQAADEKENLQRQMDERIVQIRRKADSDIEALQQEKNNLEWEAHQTREQLSLELKDTKEELSQWENEAKLQKQRNEEQQSRSEKKYQELKQQTDAQIDSLSRMKEELESQLQELKEAKELLEKKLADTEKEAVQAKSEAKAANDRAEANTLSHYIVSALKERKRRNERSGDDE